MHVYNEIPPIATALSALTNVVYRYTIHITYLLIKSRIFEFLGCHLQIHDRNHCKLSHNGIEFEGHVTKTVSGIPCQNWNSKTPHEVINDTKFVFIDINLLML